LEDQVQVAVDESLCVGTGQCEMTLPDVFTVGDEGVVTMDREAATSADPALLRRAVRNCPTSALTLAD
jgi:ferredoxin